MLSLPISTLVSGIDSEKVLEQNLKIVREFKPLTHGGKRRKSNSRRFRSPAMDGSSCSSHQKCLMARSTRKQHGFDTSIS